MEYVVEERFTDDLGFTFEKAQGGGYGRPLTSLYFMRKDNSQNVFELIEKDSTILLIGNIGKISWPVYRAI
jgi:transcriptional regulator CtsR